MENDNPSMALEQKGTPGIANGYRPLPGVADEMMAQDGALKPVWTRFIAALDRLGPETLSGRFARADQYLRDAGVYYHAYGEAQAGARDWPLSHIPVLLDEREWERITRGLTQRAELLERMIADIYGPNRLVLEGIVPPGLIAGNPEFLRPLMGVVPKSGHYLHYCAFELGRGPSGEWWVLGDRAQAPSGAGFALESRVAMTRAVADIQNEMNVHRLAGFFRNFRNALFRMAHDPTESVGILTPGPLNETYFEHAYIARYLGLMLLEGEDLSVVNGEVMVRTVAGLKPVSVLWRRMDAVFMDPLEMKPDSSIGTPGLVDALRRGTFTMVNALESGIVETRAFLAFLPRICRALLGEDLLIPSIATWWCGQEDAAHYVAANLDRMTIGNALSLKMLFEDETMRLPAENGESERLKAQILENGRDFVGQEAVRLSTTPVFIDGRLEPRPMSLRVFAGRTENGWEFMRGGFARVGRTLDTTAIAMQRGGKAADVWVVSDTPVEQVTLLPREESFTRARPGTLPSRAADNLYWLGRYIERAESSFRLLRAYHARRAEAASGGDRTLLDYLASYLESVPIETEEAIPASLAAAIDGAAFCASHIRERFSTDGWLALRDLSDTLRQMRADKLQPGDDAVHAMTLLLRKTASFSGLVHENMYRFAGWRFLELGRRLERAIHMAWVVDYLTDPAAPAGAADALLEIGDSVMTHRRRYNVNTGRRTVLDLLVLDELNPRSVLFQLAQMKTDIESLPGVAGAVQMPRPVREILRIHTALAVMDLEALTPGTLREIASEVSALSDLISKTYFG
jgi:uncharacterized circularly permuted ATP-grasp superfamily protein/uncharacterized alpha-E superfamily protein